MTDLPVPRRFPVAPGVTLAAYDWTTPGAGAAGGAAAGGRAFVLVHGLASNARLWDGVARRLAALGHPVLALDQRGHGRSDKPDGGYDMTTVAADLAAVVAAWGYERPVAVGQSWGGNVVVELAAAHPGTTAGVACVDGGFIDLAGRFPRWEDCATALAPPKLAGMARSRLEAAMRAAHTDWPDEGIAGALANFEEHPDGSISPWLTFDRHLAVLRGMWDHRPHERAVDVAEPVLWLPADSGDVAWTTDKRAALDDIAGRLRRSRTVWFSPADHDVHAQHPDRVAAVLHDATTDGFFGGTDA